MHASNGILFNHESPLRGETFVTRKVTPGGFTYRFGYAKKVYMGNLSSKRDWGHAKITCVPCTLFCNKMNPRTMS